MTFFEPDYRCPQCLSKLVGTESSLRCTGCSSVYSIRNGIIDFRCHHMDYYFNPVSRNVMAQLTQDARHESWPRIIRRFMEQVNYNPDWLDNLIVDGRYAWKLFLELPPDAKFLDLGCGLGNLTKNIAPHVGQVVALDLTWERLEFANRRFERFNPTNAIVPIAGGDGKYLPFPDAFFDCVALSGVLEWVADTYDWQGSKPVKAARMVLSFFGEKNPRTLQIKFLKEIKRILKPDGQLFVAIENRLNYEYFAARPDHHSQLWYGSLLPRFAANLYSIAVNKWPYRTYTYSLNGYRRLFRAAGFQRQEFLGFFQGYSQLSEIVPVQCDNGLQWCSPLSRELKDSIKKNKYLIPAYGIVAAPSTTRRQSLLGRIVAAIQHTAAWKTLSINNCQITGKEKAVLCGQADPHPIVIKIPLNQSAAAAVARNYHFLEGALQHLAGLVPRPILHGEIQKVAYYVEEQLQGQPLAHELVSHGYEAYFPKVLNLLQTINLATQENGLISLTDEYFHRLVVNPLEKVCEVIDDSGLKEEAYRFLREQLYGIRVRCGIQHGDFSVHNILVHNGQISGLIDWESVNTRGLPILDVLHYIESVHRAFNAHQKPEDRILLIADGYLQSDEEYLFLRKSYKLLGLDFQYHKGFTYLCWLYHMAQQLDFSLIYDTQGIKQKIESVLAAVA